MNERQLHKEIFKLWLECRINEDTYVEFLEGNDIEIHKAHLVNMVLEIDKFDVYSKITNGIYEFTLMNFNYRTIVITEYYSSKNK